MRRTVFAALVIFGLASAPAFAQQGQINSPSASTEGRASAKVSPDLAWIDFTAEATAVRTADAQKQSAAAIDAIRSSLKRVGLPDDAVKTRNYSVEPQMQYTSGKAKVIGYIARQMIEARIDDLSKLGAAIDAAGASGATAISDIRYDVKDRTSIETRLLGEAVKEGMQRASAMAAGAGKEVLTIWRIDEQRFSINQPQPMYRAVAGNLDQATSIAPRDLEVRAQVSITVILK